MPLDYHESYKHKLAKELLYNWLTLCEHDRINELPKGFRVPLCWRNGNYGVHMELPFYETSSPFYFEEGKGLKRLPNMDTRYRHHSEFFDPTIDRGKLLFIPDITIFHKGIAQIHVEVVHTNPTTKAKLKKMMKLYGTYPLEVWEISCENILSQTNKRFKLEFEQIL